MNFCKTMYFLYASLSTKVTQFSAENSEFLVVMILNKLKVLIFYMNG